MEAQPEAGQRVAAEPPRQKQPAAVGRREAERQAAGRQAAGPEAERQAAKRADLSLGWPPRLWPGPG